LALNGKRIVIGVDGGGTKTEGAIVEEGGRILAEGLFPSTNPHSNPHDQVRDALARLVSELCAKANVVPAQLDGICLGMAGADRPADQELLTGMIRPHLSENSKLVIVNDAVVAMVAVLKRLHGILVIAGTGSICLGYDGATGERVRAGGWGHFLGDEGSGYMLGLRALRSIMYSYDQRIPKTTLTDRILGELKLSSPTDLVGWIYLGKNGKTEVAALSRLVHEEAENGDAIAQQILETEAAALTELVVPVYRRLFGGSGSRVELALWGGNLLNTKRYRELFTEKVAATGLPVDPVVRDARAVLGAATHMLNSLD
jgi:N-acetylglucosamine kinase-like BadF-type ATPase